MITRSGTVQVLGGAWMILFGWVCVLLSVPGLSGEEILEMEPYEVEAWHFDALGGDVPADVVRIDGADLERGVASGITGILEETAGVQFRGVTGNGTVGQISLRGFGENSGLRVLVLVDGQPYNPPDMGGINWLGLTAEDLESVEVIRGGQSVLYGNHAVSGVVKLQTRFPEEGMNGKLSFEMGEYGTLRLGAGTGVAIGKVGLRLSGNWEESDGYRENSQFESVSFNLAGKVQSEEGTVMEGKLSWSDSEYYLPGPLSFEQMREDPRQSLNGGNERSESESLLATAQGRGEANWGQWHILGGYLRRDQDWDLGGREAANEMDRLNLSPRIQIGKKERFIITGIDVQSDWLEHQEYAGSTSRVVKSWAELERITLGSYIFGSIDLSERFVLLGGLRLEGARTDNLSVQYKENQLFPVIETNRGPIDNPDYRNPPEVDPVSSFDGVVEKSGWGAEVSLLARWNERLSTWIGWDRIYRYPALDETAAYQGYPLSEPINTELDPETGHNFELGFKHQENYWHAGLTGFFMLMDDEIIYDDIIRLNVNVGETERYGVEADLSYQRARYGITLRGAWTKAELGDGSPGEGNSMPLVAEYFVVSTAWLQIEKSLRILVTGSYRSSQYQGNDFENENRKIPAYGLLGASLEWKPSQHLVLVLSASNLLDENHASTAYSGGFYPGSGRYVSLRARLSF